MRQARQALTMVVSLVVLVVGAAILWWSVGGTQVPWQSATATAEDTIVISYVGSTCKDHSSIDVVETDDAVTVTVTERTIRLTCKDEGAPRTATISLDSALAGRALFDGSCTEPCARPLG